MNPCCLTEPNNNPLLFDPRYIESEKDLYNPLSVNTEPTRKVYHKPKKCRRRKRGYVIVQRCCFFLVALLIIAFLVKV